MTRKKGGSNLTETKLKLNLMNAVRVIRINQQIKIYIIYFIKIFEKLKDYNL